MSMVAAVYPTRSGKQRQKGVRKRYVGVRLPEHLDAYITTKEGEGVAQTDAVIELMDIALDIIEGVGADWGDILKRSYLEKVRPGVAAARQLKDGLACLRGEKPKK